jgi:hypothetical protein
MAWTRTLVNSLATAVFSTACFHGGVDVPLSGSWESDEDVSGYLNTLDIEEDLIGSATLYFYFDDDPTLYYADYTAIATILDASNSYLVSMICDGNGNECSDLDFTMTCRVTEGMYLDCIGSDRFATYDNLSFTRPMG